MNRQAKFEDFPLERDRFNRRVYGAVKAPFAFIGRVIWELFCSLVETTIKLAAIILLIALRCIVFCFGCFLVLGILLAIFNFFVKY